MFMVGDMTSDDVKAAGVQLSPRERDTKGYEAVKL